MYFLIITLGFLLAMRGARPAPLQRPVEGLQRVWREAVDFFLTTSLILTCYALTATSAKIQILAQEFSVLVLGLAAFLISRYQKKTDVFFLSVLASVFAISSKQFGPWQGVLLCGVVSLGIAIFQTCFLGMRYKLLFSNMPASVKGWPSLCLLAGCISLVLWGLGDLVF